MQTYQGHRHLVLCFRYRGAMFARADDKEMIKGGIVVMCLGNEYVGSHTTSKGVVRVYYRWANSKFEIRNK